MPIPWRIDQTVAGYTILRNETFTSQTIGVPTTLVQLYTLRTDCPPFGGIQTPGPDEMVESGPGDIHNLGD